MFSCRENIQKLNVSPSLIIEKMAENCHQKSDVHCEFYENSEDVPDPRNLSTSCKNLIIFDDIMLLKQNKCESYYVRGRHSNVDCFYLAQNHFMLPRQTIRGSANFIILFKQDLKNLNHIYNDHVSNDMTKEEFRILCKKAWKNPHGFVVVDLSIDPQNGKYRSGFDEFYIT